MIELLVKNSENKVITVPPLYCSRYFWISLKNASAEVTRILIQGTKSFFNRLIFADEDDQLYHFKANIKSVSAKRMRRKIQLCKVRNNENKGKDDMIITSN